MTATDTRAPRAHDTADSARTLFAERFGMEPVGTWSAPGRVNLIGEHTDYNDGFVLPAAIDRGISISFVSTTDRRVELTRLDDGERAAFELDAIEPAAGRWIDYVAGTAWAMTEAGLPTTGFRGAPE